MDVPVDRDKVERSSWPLAELGRRLRWAKQKGSAAPPTPALDTRDAFEQQAASRPEPAEVAPQLGDDWLIARSLRRA